MFGRSKKLTTTNQSDMRQIKLLSNAPAANETTEKYADLLMGAVEQPEVLNIALMGGYCTGKSSILAAFKRKYGEDNDASPWEDRLRIKEISFVALRNDSSSSTLPINSPDETPLSHSLQKEIVSQLYYETKPKLLDRSKFTRINPRISYAIGAMVLFAFLAWHLPLILQEIQNWWSILLKILLELGVLIPAFVLIVGLSGKIRLKRLGFGDISVELSDQQPDFEQLLDELINIFRKTKYDVVIFEDLDRFNDIKIYEDLRQLNYKLNHAEQIEQPVKFIYAMRDSLIPDGSDRNKLFDEVIPVVPFTSPHNIEEYLRKQLADAGIKINNAQLCRVIAVTLGEARQIAAFVNAAVMHLDCICNGEERLAWLNEDEVIAIAFIRQLWPEEYEALQHGESNIDKVFDFGARKKSEHLNGLREKLGEAQKTGDQEAIEQKQRKYSHERKQTVWATVEDDLKDIEIRQDISGKLSLPQSERDSFLDILQRLIATGTLSDSFRACIAPYHGSKVSRKTLNFINNSLYRKDIPEYDIKFSVAEIQKITSGRTKYDFDSIAFLNFSIMDAVIDGHVKQITPQEFIEIQQQNLIELILFHDAYAHHCIDEANAGSGASISRLRHFVRILLQLCPEDLIGHALISGLLDPAWPVYVHTNHLFLKAMSDNGTKLASEDVPRFINAINQFYSIDGESVKNIIKNNNIMFDKIDCIDKQSQGLIDFVVENELFVVNAHNLAIIPETANLSNLLSNQRPNTETLRQILSKASEIPAQHINDVLDYIFQHFDLDGLERDVANAIIAKSISLSSNRTVALIRNLKDNHLAIKVMLLAQLTDDEFMSLLKQLGDSYSKLTEPNKRPNFADTKIHQELVQRLVDMGKVTRISSKSGRIAVRVCN